MEGTPAYDVAKVVVDSVILTQSYPATLGANTSFDLVFRVDGTCTSLNVDGGKWVKKGTVLATLDPTTYQDAVTQAKARLESAQSSYEYYSKQYAAMVKALEGDAVSEMDVNQSKSNMLSAQASIAEARAALETARTNLSYCTVVAPMDGHISDTSLSVGQYINGSAQPTSVCTIYDDLSVRAEFSIGDACYYQMVDAVSKGLIDLNHMEVTFQDLEIANKYYAHVSYIDPAVDTNTGTVTIKAMIDNPEVELKPGMFCFVHLPYGASDHAILVKDTSIGTDQLGKYVYCVNDSDKVVYTHIETGDRVNDSMRIVTAGLNPNTRYVTKAMLKVRDGETIKPIMTK